VQEKSTLRGARLIDSIAMNFRATRSCDNEYFLELTQE